jgi:ParB-like nuclease domain
MKIEYTPVRELRAYPNNARTHSRKQVGQIAKSIEKFGFCNPVLIDDTKQIIAGHGRVEAAKLLGIETVPTCRLSHLSHADKRAYVLADNKLAEKAGWDRELLAIELQGLIEIDVDIELTGFEMAEIDLILEEAREATGDPSGPEDEVPERSPGPAVTQTGDLWLLGTHRLLCGDARAEAAYHHLLAGGKPEFVFTDPPYNVAIDGNVCGLGRVRHREFAMGSGEMSEGEFTAFLVVVFGLLAENTVDGSTIRSAWTGATCGRCSPPAARSIASSRTSASGTRATPAWAHSTARSTSSCSCGSPGPQRTPTISSLDSMGVTGQMSGITPASTPCARDGWKSWRCTQRSNRPHWSRTRSRIARAAVAWCSTLSAAAARS